MLECRACAVTKDKNCFSGGNKKCKPCVSKSNIELYKTQGRSYQRTKEELKQGKSCEMCGRTDFLQFDHLDPSKKSFTIAHSFSSTAIKKEAKKCRLLCIWCHRLHSFNTRTIDQDKRNKELKQSIIDVPEDDNGTICHGYLCNGRRLPNDMFWLRNGRPKGNCKICASLKQHNTRKKIQKYIDETKRNMGFCDICNIECTNGNESCFDWDHVDPSKKRCNISVFVSRHTTDTNRIDREISKCRLLCCFCHFTHSNSVKVFCIKRNHFMHNGELVYDDLAN